MDGGLIMHWGRRRGMSPEPNSGGTTNFGLRRQEGIYIAGFVGRAQAVPVSAERLEAAALRKLSRDAAAYFAGSAGLERTAAANRAAFERCRIVQRMMRDVSTRDLT